MRKRRTFSREFKREAATMVLDQGHPLAHICLQGARPPGSCSIQTSEASMPLGSFARCCGAIESNRACAEYWQIQD